jgi:hypothetical protein
MASMLTLRFPATPLYGGNTLAEPASVFKSQIAPNIEIDRAFQTLSEDTEVAHIHRRWEMHSEGMIAVVENKAEASPCWIISSAHQLEHSSSGKRGSESLTRIGVCCIVNGVLNHFLTTLFSAPIHRPFVQPPCLRTADDRHLHLSRARRQRGRVLLRSART